MTKSVRAILLGVMLVTLLIAVAWQSVSHFEIDPMGFTAGLVLLPAPLGLGLYYTYIRKDERIAAMLLGACFLIAYAPIASVLTYFCLSITGPRIDDALAAADRAIGFDWPSLMIWASNHPFMVAVMKWPYILVVWGAPITVFLLGWRADPSDISKYCLSLAISAYLTFIIWTVFPAFGAITVYGLPPLVAAKLHVILDLNYANSLVDIYKHGPGKITFGNTKGLIGFPSYHTILALVPMWFTRKCNFLRWPYLLLGTIAIAATPIHGGHHLMDVLGGLVVGAIGIMLASAAVDAAIAIDQNGPFTSMNVSKTPFV